MFAFQPNGKISWWIHRLGGEISSAHGTTQGDPIAMPLYAVAIAPLLQMIKSDGAQDVRHVDLGEGLVGLYQLDSAPGGMIS